jgi:hypothetical protein
MSIRILAPNALERSKGQRKIIRSTTWTLSSMFIINYFFTYILFVITKIFFYLYPILKYPPRLSAFTRGGAYKVIPDTIELSKTLDPWPGY